MRSILPVLSIVLILLSAIGASGQMVSCYANVGSQIEITPYPAFSFDDTACVAYCFQGKEYYGMFSTADVNDMKKQKGLYQNLHSCSKENCNAPGTTHCDSYLTFIEYYSDKATDPPCEGIELQTISYITGRCHPNLQSGKYETFGCNDTVATITTYTDAACTKGTISKVFPNAKFDCMTLSSKNGLYSQKWTCSTTPPPQQEGQLNIIERGYDDGVCNLEDSILISEKVRKSGACFGVTNTKYEKYMVTKGSVIHDVYTSGTGFQQCASKPTTSTTMPSKCTKASSTDAHAGNYYIYSFSANTPSPTMSPSDVDLPTEEPTPMPISDDGTLSPTLHPRSAKYAPTLRPSASGGPTKFPTHDMVTSDEAVLIGAVMGAIGFILVTSVVAFCVIRRIRIRNDEKIRQWASEHQTSGESYNQPIHGSGPRAVSTDGIELKGVSSKQ